MKLIASLTSPYVRKVRIALAEKLAPRASFAETAPPTAPAPPG